MEEANDQQLRRTTEFQELLSISRAEEMEQRDLALSEQQAANTQRFLTASAESNVDKMKRLSQQLSERLQEIQLEQETQQASKALAEKRQLRELGAGGETTQPKAKAKVAAENLGSLPSSSTNPRGSRQARQRESSQPPEITGNEVELPERRARSRSPPKKLQPSRMGIQRLRETFKEAINNNKINATDQGTFNNLYQQWVSARGNQNQKLRAQIVKELQQLYKTSIWQKKY